MLYLSTSSLLHLYRLSQNCLPRKKGSIWVNVIIWILKKKSRILRKDIINLTNQSWAPSSFLLSSNLSDFLVIPKAELLGCELQENLFQSLLLSVHACILWRRSSGTGCICTTIARQKENIFTLGTFWSSLLAFETEGYLRLKKKVASDNRKLNICLYRV
jgi:hypothetical protein